MAWSGASTNRGNDSHPASTESRLARADKNGPDHDSRARGQDSLFSRRSQRAAAVGPHGDTAKSRRPGTVERLVGYVTG